MDLNDTDITTGGYGFPHTRGDGPLDDIIGGLEPKFSPHTWGWTKRARCESRLLIVFPTHVGMDLHGRMDRRQSQSFPHTRGDGPLREDI